METSRNAFSAWKKIAHDTPMGRIAFSAVLVLVVLLLLVNFTVASGNTLHTEPELQSNWSASLSCAGVFHVVRPGQTIYSIAALYGSTAYRIRICNGLRSYSVYVGQGLLVPTRYSNSGRG